MKITRGASPAVYKGSIPSVENDPAKTPDQRSRSGSAQAAGSVPKRSSQTRKSDKPNGESLPDLHTPNPHSSTMNEIRHKSLPPASTPMGLAGYRSSPRNSAGIPRRDSASYDTSTPPSLTHSLRKNHRHSNMITLSLSPKALEAFGDLIHHPLDHETMSRTDDNMDVDRESAHDDSIDTMHVDDDTPPPEYPLEMYPGAFGIDGTSDVPKAPSETTSTSSVTRASGRKRKPTIKALESLESERSHKRVRNASKPEASSSRKATPVENKEPHKAHKELDIVRSSSSPDTSSPQKDGAAVQKTSSPTIQNEHDIVQNISSSPDDSGAQKDAAAGQKKSSPGVQKELDAVQNGTPDASTQKDATAEQEKSSPAVQSEPDAIQHISSADDSSAHEDADADQEKSSPVVQKELDTAQNKTPDASAQKDATADQETSSPTIQKELDTMTPDASAKQDVAADQEKSSPAVQNESVQDISSVDNIAQNTSPPQTNDAQDEQEAEANDAQEFTGSTATQKPPTPEATDAQKQAVQEMPPPATKPARKSRASAREIGAMAGRLYALVCEATSEGFEPPEEVHGWLEEKRAIFESKKEQHAEKNAQSQRAEPPKDSTKETPAEEEAKNEHPELELPDPLQISKKGDGWIPTGKVNDHGEELVMVGPDYLPFKPNNTYNDPQLPSPPVRYKSNEQEKKDRIYGYPPPMGARNAPAKTAPFRVENVIQESAEARALKRAQRLGVDFGVAATLGADFINAKIDDYVEKRKKLGYEIPPGVERPEASRTKLKRNVRTVQAAKPNPRRANTSKARAAKQAKANATRAKETSHQETSHEPTEEVKTTKATATQGAETNAQPKEKATRGSKRVTEKTTTPKTPVPKKETTNLDTDAKSTRVSRKKPLDSRSSPFLDAEAKSSRGRRKTKTAEKKDTAPKGTSARGSAKRKADDDTPTNATKRRRTVHEVETPAPDTAQPRTKRKRDDGDTTKATKRRRVDDEPKTPVPPPAPVETPRKKKREDNDANGTNGSTKRRHTEEAETPVPVPQEAAEASPNRPIKLKLYFNQNKKDQDQKDTAPKALPAAEKTVPKKSKVSGPSAEEAVPVKKSRGSSTKKTAPPTSTADEAVPKKKSQISKARESEKNKPV